jgi:NAD(P)H-hydrate epimerase
VDGSLTVSALPVLPLPALPPRKPDAHKGDFGRALLVGGSRGMSGAIALAGLAALRSGAGLVTLAVPDVCLETVAAFEPSYMTAALACDEAGRIRLEAVEEIFRLAGGANCIACGPGVSRSPQLTRLVARLYEALTQPLVLDADGLNAFATLGGERPTAAAPRILTPHPGEFRRLVGEPDSRASRDELCGQAIELAARCGWVLVLKGHRTLITDGRRVTYNTSGNPGMATGGAGDVLTGVITALVCQGLAPFEAAQLGVYLHGLAGDLAAEQLGQVSLIARDLVTYLPQAFRRLIEGIGQDSK